MSSQSPIPGYLNAAGEWEREARSRRFNAIEGLAAILVVLVLLWPVVYLAGDYGENEAVNRLAGFVLAGGAIYILFVSPRLHRDSLESWGLGSPRRLWRVLKSLSGARRGVLLMILAGIFLALNYMSYHHWHEVAKFFRFEGTALERAREASFPGNLPVFAFGSLLAFVILTCCVRYDNFLSALKTAFTVAFPLFGVICLAAFMQRGTAAFAGFSLSEFLLGVFGYLFWGFVQQLLFSSYFGTRFRKGFAPGEAPGNSVPPDRRARVAVGFGLGAAAVGAVGLFVLLRLLYGAGQVSPGAVAYFVAFLFPLGALYGYFFCLDKKRLLVATLAASCFGLIHIDSYGLVIGTWILGTILAYIFMEDRNRNLVALGFIHGLNGSTLNWLFSKGGSGAYEIDYNVGPWNIEAPTAWAALFPMMCVCVYVLILIFGVLRPYRRA